MHRLIVNVVSDWLSVSGTPYMEIVGYCRTTSAASGIYEYANTHPYMAVASVPARRPPPTTWACVNYFKIYK